MGSILAQTCMESDPVYEIIRAKYAGRSGRPTSKPPRLDVDALVDLIIRQAQYRKHLYIALDGVNECSDPCGLLQALKRILTSATGVRLLMSSINEKGIERSIACMPKTFEVTIAPTNIQCDVRLFVSSALETHPRLKALPQGLKDDIGVKLTNGAQGM